jgi:opacity protein-like surface antigen
MNKLTLLLALAAFASVSQAVAEENATTFSGPYVSLGAGYQHNTIKKENVSAVSGSPSFDQANASDRDFVGRIQAGYGRDLYKNFNVSVGVFYDIGGNKVNDIKATFYQDNVKQSIENTAGVFIATGYYINQQTLVFLKAGYVRADKEYIRAKAPDINISQNDSVDGYLWGFGVKHLLTKKVFVGADVSRYTYESSSSIANLNGLEVRVSSKPEQTNALLSLGYMF